MTTAAQSPFSYFYGRRWAASLASPSAERGPDVKGVIVNLAEEVVRRQHGEDVWDAILLGAGLDGSWTSLGSYPTSTWNGS